MTFEQFIKNRDTELRLSSKSKMKRMFDIYSNILYPSELIRSSGRFIYDEHRAPEVPAIQQIINSQFNTAVTVSGTGNHTVTFSNGSNIVFDRGLELGVPSMDEERREGTYEDNE